MRLGSQSDAPEVSTGIECCSHVTVASAMWRGTVSGLCNSTISTMAISVRFVTVSASACLNRALTGLLLAPTTDPSPAVTLVRCAIVPRGLATLLHHLLLQQISSITAIRTVACLLLFNCYIATAIGFAGKIQLA